MTSETSKVRPRNWCSSVFVAGAVGVAAHLGCSPDFDALLVGPGSGGSGTGGHDSGKGGADSAGGTYAGGGESGKASGGESSDRGGASSDAGQNGGGVGGLEGGAGGAWNASGGAIGSGGTTTMPSTGGVGGGPDECVDGLSTCPELPECSVDLDVGSETGLTVSHCGACGIQCSLNNAASARCEGGSCQPECAPHFGDCNAASDNDGCETFLNSQDNCGNTCADAEACTALNACNAGECMVAQGVVELSIPFSATGQGQRFAERFSPMPDLTGKTLTLRLYAPGEFTAGILMTIYPTDKDFRGGPAVPVFLDDLNQGWKDIVIPMGEATTTFDPLAVYQLTFDIQSGAGPWEPVTNIYVDAIWSSDGVINDTFATSYGQTVKSTMLNVEGSAYQWLDALPAAD